MIRLKNYGWGFEQIKIWNIHIKIKRVSGEKRWLKVTHISPGYTYPPKFLCAAFQMQYHKTNGLWTPKEWNNTTQIFKMEKMKYTFHCFKAVSQLNVYHFFT